MRTSRTVALVAAGGVVGALARWVSPWPTVVTNVVGCVLMGALAVVLERRFDAPWVRPLLAAGLLGGYTTFSAYAVDVASPLADGRPGAALVHLALTPAAALVGLVAGAAVARRLVPPRAAP